MKALLVLVLIALCVVGFWGNSQYKSKKDLTKQVASCKSKLKKSEKEYSEKKQYCSKVEQQLVAEKSKARKLDSENKSLSRLIAQKEAKIKALKLENTKLAMVRITNTSKHSSNKVITLKQAKKNEKKYPALQKTKTLRKIRLINQQISTLKYKKKNVDYSFIKMDKKEDIKGWYYYGKGNKDNIQPPHTMPDRKKGVRVVYISKSEKKAKLKAEYQKKIDELIKLKSKLEKSIK